MRELTINEMQQVEGGNLVIAVIGIAGAIFYFGYEVGKDMAERDNAAQDD